MQRSEAANSGQLDRLIILRPLSADGSGEDGVRLLQGGLAEALAAAVRQFISFYLSGMGGGLTLPQSEPLKTDEESMVYSMVLELAPIGMVPTK